MLKLTTISQQHGSHNNMIFACQHSLRHRDGQMEPCRQDNDGMTEQKMGAIEAGIVGIL